MEEQRSGAGVVERRGEGGGESGLCEVGGDVSDGAVFLSRDER